MIVTAITAAGAGLYPGTRKPFWRRKPKKLGKIFRQEKRAEIEPQCQGQLCAHCCAQCRLPGRHLFSEFRCGHGDCVGGVYFLHVGVIGSLLIYNLGLAAGVANATLPLLKSADRKSHRRS